ncbi:hypothetical protein [Vibrio sp. 10N]|uniref:hypothetical protein n=1 Tax=Vibrio sp. 10N TaxID=3058938 RepID=UPI00281465DA|nr:hypothetical protein VB10N_22560 [Vibrio sp. 10N]
MKYLTKNWKQRSAVILLISLIVSGLMWSVEFSSWAESINESAMALEPQNDEKSAPFLFMFAMSFIKLIVLTSVPFFVTYGVLTLLNKVKKRSRGTPQPSKY